MMMLVCLREKSSVFEVHRLAVANSLSSFLVKFGSLTIDAVFVVMRMIGSKTKSISISLMYQRFRANETFDNVIKPYFSHDV